MKEQNYKNHNRLVPLYHLGLLAIIIFILVVSIMNLVRYGHGKSMNIWYAPVMFLAIAVSMLIQFWYSRAFAARVQDRAIRAEENLRNFALTGKLLDPALRMDQVIALRFAPDEEFITLTQQAKAENLTNKQIKQRIQNWKADHHRA